MSMLPMAAFASEAEERAHGEQPKSGSGPDWRRAEAVRPPNLKPTTTAISLRLPVSLPDQIKIAANKPDVPYPSLVKMWLAEKVG